jgi:arsenite methyltransferase
MKPDYGLDAPGLVRMFFIIGAVCLALIVVMTGFFGHIALVAYGLVPVLALVSAYTLFMGCFMIWGSRVEKRREREQVLDLVAWIGSEQVLDVGCGRGLMMIGAARRLTTGKAVGIDIWRAEDQSGNTKDAALANAEIEQVRDRVEVETADMRVLPFDDARFDVVLSSWVLHNLDARADRKTALGEMVRVLKPGGTLLLTDIVNRKDYLSDLAALPVQDVQLVILSPAKDRFRSAVSFGSFQPATILARRV